VLYVRVGILLACAKHLDDRITLLRWEVWAHKYSLTPPLIMEVSVPRQEIAQSCIYVLGVPILILHFGIVPTVWCFGIVPTVWYFGIVPTV